MIEQKQILKNADMSADIASEALLFNNTTRMSIHAIFTGSPVGVLKLQCSNDILPDNRGADVVNWVTYANAVAINSASQVMYNLSDISFKWIRLVYTATSGTGSLSATFHSIGQVD